MESSAEIILLGSALILLSIIIGQFSSRFGVPLLLVFLILGMLAGEDGPGGIYFSDHRSAYLISSISLAIILFEGGLRTPKDSFKAAFAPAFVLATLGVIITNGIVSYAAVKILHLTWLQSFLFGSIISSTDAAAVFLILRNRNIALRQRVSATLEVESGINDPMAVFLTLSCINLLVLKQNYLSINVIENFFTQMIGGTVLGFAGGFILLKIIKNLKIARGLYPILAAAFALFIFSCAQLLETSGFLAVYLAGLILGQSKQRNIKNIINFHDGLAWLCQICMFLMLGLLSTPSELIPNLKVSLILAIVLMLLARPIAVYVCLLPFKFSFREKLFIGWTGLRGAVPIFLASLPILKGIDNANTYFSSVFVIVLLSLIIQGWTVSSVAKFLKVGISEVVE